MGCGSSTVQPAATTAMTPAALQRRKDAETHTAELTEDQLRYLEADPSEWTGRDMVKFYVRQVWEHYAVKPDCEEMRKTEMQTLARDCVNKFMKLFRALLREKHGKMDEKRFENKVNSQRPVYLPGVDVADCIECTYYFLGSECKMQKGVVTKAAFFLNFPRAHERLLHIDTLKMTEGREALVDQLKHDAIRRSQQSLKQRPGTASVAIRPGSSAGITSVRSSSRPGTSDGTMSKRVGSKNRTGSISMGSPRKAGGGSGVNSSVDWKFDSEAKKLGIAHGMGASQADLGVVPEQRPRSSAHARGVSAAQPPSGAINTAVLGDTHGTLRSPDHARSNSAAVSPLPPPTQQH